MNTRDKELWLKANSRELSHFRGRNYVFTWSPKYGTQPVHGINTERDGAINILYTKVKNKLYNTCQDYTHNGRT